MVVFALVMILLSGDGDMIKVQYDNNMDQTQCVEMAEKLIYKIESGFMVVDSFCVKLQDV